MRILVTGTSCVGKSTFINDFLEQWPMYKCPKRSYREEAKDQNIKLNKDGDVESQRKIQKILVEQLEAHKNESHVIFDRGPLDNLVYSIWLNIKKIGNVDDLFIEQSIMKVKQTVSVYDIIFFIPIIKDRPINIVPDDQRDTDPIFREEIDNLFKGIIQTWHKGKDTFFPKENCPAIIEIFGNPQERIEIAKLYINSAGDSFTETDALIDLSNIDTHTDVEEDIKDLIKEKSISQKNDILLL